MSLFQLNVLGIIVFADVVLPHSMSAQQGIVMVSLLWG